MIYLDNAATTPMRPEVIEVIHQSLLDDFGNPSSTYSTGKSAKYKMLMARRQIADLLDIAETNLYITSGATEANNWAIRSQAFKSREITGGNHIVTTMIEHPSVIKVTQYLEQVGFNVTYLVPNTDGKITVDDFQAATTSKTVGWICMAVNNELGTLLPVFDLGERAEELGLWFHVDTVQAIGHLDWNFKQLKCTSFVGSAHKFNGPKGIGFLVYRPFRSEMHLEPLLYGGGQENEKRSGTENVPYILGLAKALELSMDEQTDTLKKYYTLQEYLFQSLDALEIPYIINGPAQERVPYINNIWFQGHAASQLLIKLDLADVHISAGSACTAGSLTPSRILESYYPDQPKRWEESLRISFGYHTIKDDIDQLVESLAQIYKGEVNLWHSKK